MLFRTALCTTAALMFSAGAALAASHTDSAALDSRPATRPTQVEEMKVGEEVGYVFEVDLGAVPGATYVEVLPGELPAASLAAAGREEEEAPAEGVAEDVVEDVPVEDESYETEAVDEDGVSEGEEPEADADGEYVEVEMEEVPAGEEGSEAGSSPAGAEEDGESYEEPAEDGSEVAPPALEDEASDPDGAEAAGG